MSDKVDIKLPITIDDTLRSNVQIKQTETAHKYSYFDLNQLNFKRKFDFNI